MSRTLATELRLRREFAVPEPAEGTTVVVGAAARAARSHLTDVDRRTFLQRRAALEQRFPPPPDASVRHLVDHIDHVVRTIGVDHVGIASDFDGGGGIDGWRDARETFNVTLALVRRGYSEDEVAKIWGGNLLRAMKETDQIGDPRRRRR